MLSFRLFLRKLKVPILATAGLVVAIIAYHFLAYAVERRYIMSQIYYYQKFQHVDDPLPKGEKESGSATTFRWFVYFTRDSVGTTGSPAHRLDSLRNLGKNYRDNSSTFRYNTGSDPALMSTLLFEKDKIPALIKTEEAKRKKLDASFDPYPSRWFVYRVFRWISIGWLIIAWMDEGRFNVFYFPTRTWWFYGYLALTFPASLVLAIVTLVGEALGFLATMADARQERFRTAFENMKKRFRSKATYDELCAKIVRDKNAYRKTWVDSFSAQRVNVQARQETGRLTGLKQTLVRKGEEMETMQRDYFESRDRLRQLGKMPDANQRIGEEFDELYKHPSVKALEIKDDKLMVYTESFAGSGGLVGPFRIEISIPGGTKEVFLATDSARKHPVGGGETGHFCFGNANGMITKLLQEFRFTEATGLMFQAFESS